MMPFRAMKNKILLLAMASILLSNANIYPVEGSGMKNESVNLVERFNLYEIDKIEIKGEDFDKEVREKIFILDKKPEIDKLIEGLKSVENQPLCDCKPRFRLLLYKQEQLILDLGFQNYDDHYYLRYKNEEQFVPDKEFLESLNNLIKYK
jgi:hypothetical protein